MIAGSPTLIILNLFVRYWPCRFLRSGIDGYSYLGVFQTAAFHPELVEQMKGTSEQIALTLENARSYANLEASYRYLDHFKKDIEAYSKALDDELENGRQFQKNFLPADIPRLPNWEIATYFAPVNRCPVIFMIFFHYRVSTSG
jgi:hypothetical protein